MKDILNQLFDYHALDKQQAKDTLIKLAQGDYNHSQIAAFLTVYLMRNITVKELEGFRDAMLELCIPVDFDGKSVVDLCGTGGDGKNTFNISTTASFVVAGAGQAVSKHGNYGVSSISGSSNLLEHLGYTFTNDTDHLRKSLDEANICFLHAPLFHPAMKNVAPIRKELGVKTFFNMLGPMVNPAKPANQLVGVFNQELARLYGYIYQNTHKNYSIVHTLDGYDEISLTSPSKIISNTTDTVLQAKDFGLNDLTQKDLHGGDTVGESADIFLNILQNKSNDAQKNVVLANAGLTLYTCGKADTLEASVQLAKESLESGKAYKAFKNLIELNKKL
ncbi:MAG: anthranilate phosphoribosyltransferase [Bacteroidota bacterium]